MNFCQMSIQINYRKKVIQKVINNYTSELLSYVYIDSNSSEFLRSSFQSLKTNQSTRTNHFCSKAICIEGPIVLCSIISVNFGVFYAALVSIISLFSSCLGSLKENFISATKHLFHLGSILFDQY